MACNPSFKEMKFGLAVVSGYCKDELRLYKRKVEDLIRELYPFVSWLNIWSAIFSLKLFLISLTMIPKSHNKDNIFFFLSSVI